MSVANKKVYRVPSYKCRRWWQREGRVQLTKRSKFEVTAFVPILSRCTNKLVVRTVYSDIRFDFRLRSHCMASTNAPVLRLSWLDADLLLNCDYSPSRRLYEVCGTYIVCSLFIDIQIRSALSCLVSRSDCSRLVMIFFQFLPDCQRTRVMRLSLTLANYILIHVSSQYTSRQHKLNQDEQQLILKRGKI